MLSKQSVTMLSVRGKIVIPLMITAGRPIKKVLVSIWSVLITRILLSFGSKMNTPSASFFDPIHIGHIKIGTLILKNGNDSRNHPGSWS